MKIFDEKFKIRVSVFLKETIDHDAKAFNFVKKDGDANYNLFLNKLIPNLFEVNKLCIARVVENAKTASGIKELKASDVYSIIAARDAAYEKLYFNDFEMDKLTETLWIRPSTENISVFDEIFGNEIQIAEQDMSTYIRNMLNEYSKLLEFKREQMVFREEMEMALLARKSGRILKFRYGEELKRTYVFACVYAYLREQGNYILCYDIERKIICRYQLSEIRALHLIKEKYKPSEKLRQLCERYEDGALWIDDEVLEWEEG